MGCQQTKQANNSRRMAAPKNTLLGRETQQGAFDGKGMIVKASAAPVQLCSTQTEIQQQVTPNTSREFAIEEAGMGGDGVDIGANVEARSPSTVYEIPDVMEENAEGKQKIVAASDVKRPDGPEPAEEHALSADDRKPDIDALFAAAIGLIRNWNPATPGEASNAEKLRLYGLYKQALEGDCTQKEPWKVQVEAYAKWQAWSKVKGVTSQEAKLLYVGEVDAQRVKYGLQAPTVV